MKESKQALATMKKEVVNYDKMALAIADVQKVVNIGIDLKDLDILKKAHYKLCFAKKVGNNEFNVVWQSYHDYLFTNEFSWTPLYQLFGSNKFESNVRVHVATNLMDIGLGQSAELTSSGILLPPFDQGPETGFTMVNGYGPIHTGVNQISTGLNGERVSTPIYVSENPVVLGETLLTPVEKVLVWFEQDIETSTMFSTSRSKAVEIDLTHTNTATRFYKDGKWTTPR